MATTVVPEANGGYKPGSNINNVTRLSEARSRGFGTFKAANINPIQNSLEANTDAFDVINTYRTTLTYIIPTVGPKTKAHKNADGKEEEGQYLFKQIASPSLFNPYFAVNSTGITRHTPLLDTTKTNTKFSAIPKDDTIGGSKNTSQNYSPYDLSDCSIKNLVFLSDISTHGATNLSVLGNARYKYSDFMYCKELGKMSNTHLITLRKFAAPVPDNIFQYSSIRDKDSNMETAGDIGRLVTWFGTEDNKLEDILKYSFRSTWKELNSEIQEQESQEDSAERGILGSIVNTLNPNYASAVARGAAPNAIGGLLGASGGDMFFSSAPYRNNPAVNGSAYDKNKIYEPRDTIRSTYIYEGKLEFEQEITLTFNYKLRAYDNINPKSAFLDLLANVLQVTYKKGTFWPGEQRVIGPPGSKSGWGAATDIASHAVAGTANAGTTLIANLLGGSSMKESFSLFGSQMSSVFNGVLGSLGASSVGDLLGQLKQNITNGGALTKNVEKMMAGSMMNSLGRPAIYAFNSLLTNAPVGMWHLTIGNPLNPIAVMGNMIMTDASIQQYGPLGLDDFPTELKVTVTLKHGMPRDAVDIGKMYTRGEQGIYHAIPGFMFKGNGAVKTEANTKKGSETGTTKKTHVEELANSLHSGIVPGPYKYKDYRTTPGLGKSWVGDTDLVRIKVNSEQV